MKLKSLAGLCKKEKRIFLYDKIKTNSDYTAQWIGDGYAIYPITGLPYLEEESIFTIFDVTESQSEGYLFQQNPLPAGLCFEDTDTAEKIIEGEKISIVAAGRTLKPLQTRNGLVFIDAKYISPLAEVAETLEYYERVTDDGHTYIAAKAGFMLMAVIMPYDIVTEDFVKQMQHLTCECAFALQNKKQDTPAEQDAEQFTFDAGLQCDPDTGEVIDESGGE